MPSDKMCSILSCPNSSRLTRSADARCFSIPLSTFYRKKWKDWIMRENAPIERTLKCFYVCEKHFTKSCFLPNGKLAGAVVPSISCKGDVPSSLPQLEQHAGSCLQNESHLTDILNSKDFTTSNINSNLARISPSSPKNEEDSHIIPKMDNIPPIRHIHLEENHLDAPLNLSKRDQGCLLCSYPHIFPQSGEPQIPERVVTYKQFSLSI